MLLVVVYGYVLEQYEGESWCESVCYLEVVLWLYWFLCDSEVFCYVNCSGFVFVVKFDFDGGCVDEWVCELWFFGCVLE